MTDLERWHIAWKNIWHDYLSGTISRHQYLKERDYMREARLQIEEKLND